MRGFIAIDQGWCWGRPVQALNLVSGGLLILMSFSAPFNLASGGFLATPPLISNRSNLPFGTQGRSWRLESCLQETGDKKKKASVPRTPTRPHSVSNPENRTYTFQGPHLLTSAQSHITLLGFRN